MEIKLKDSNIKIKINVLDEGEDWNIPEIKKVITQYINKINNLFFIKTLKKDLKQNDFRIGKYVVGLADGDFHIQKAWPMLDFYFYIFRTDGEKAEIGIISKIFFPDSGYEYKTTKEYPFMNEDGKILPVNNSLIKAFEKNLMMESYIFQKWRDEK